MYEVFARAVLFLGMAVALAVFAMVWVVLVLLIGPFYCLSRFPFRVTNHG